MIRTIGRTRRLLTYPRLPCPSTRSQDLRDRYDVVVIGGGLGGMTAANVLARAGRSVLLAEQHHKLGGLATWFHRGPNVFDVALHGFPVGMIKSCRRYWTQRDRRLDRPVEGHPLRQPDVLALHDLRPRGFHAAAGRAVPRAGRATSRSSSTAARNMNFYDDQATTAGQLFERFFPGREDVVRLLMEPITYANGSTLEDPALTYGIVFSNFMSKGVYTFRGGTEQLIRLMRAGIGAKRRRCPHAMPGREGPRRTVRPRRVEGVTIGGRHDRHARRWFPTPICWARSSTLSAPSIGTAISSNRPGRSA